MVSLHQNIHGGISHIDRSREIQAYTLAESLGGIQNNILHAIHTISDVSRDYTEVRHSLRNEVDAGEERFFRLDSDRSEDELHILARPRSRSADQFYPIVV